MVIIIILGEFSDGNHSLLFAGKLLPDAQPGVYPRRQGPVHLTQRGASRSSISQRGLDSRYCSQIPAFWVPTRDLQLGGVIFKNIFHHFQTWFVISTPGSVEVMLEVRSLRDDSRGLGDGVKDNLPTPSTLRILLEPHNMPIKQGYQVGLDPSLRHRC